MNTKKLRVYKKLRKGRNKTVIKRKGSKRKPIKHTRTKKKRGANKMRGGGSCLGKMCDSLPFQLQDPEENKAIRDLSDLPLYMYHYPKITDKVEQHLNAKIEIEKKRTKRDEGFDIDNTQLTGQVIESMLMVAIRFSNLDWVKFLTKNDAYVRGDFVLDEAKKMHNANPGDTNATNILEHLKTMRNIDTPNIGQLRNDLTSGQATAKNNIVSNVFGISEIGNKIQDYVGQAAPTSQHRMYRSHIIPPQLTDDKFRSPNKFPRKFGTYGVDESDSD